MGDSSDSDKKASIPNWQRASSSPSSEDNGQTSAPTASQANDPESTSRATLLDQASRFLQDESIKDAPTDRKIAFLESKGLTNGEVHQILGISRNPEATGVPDNDTRPNAELKTASDSTAEASKSESSNPPVAQPERTAQKPLSPPPARDVPPVITYPEFLLQPSKPPPLLTFRSVLYTLYGAAGLAATLYGASEYLVNPMLASLNSARHELAATAQQNLEKLNEKLELNVSTIPPHALSKRRKDGTEQKADEEDVESITSDPTELFHRDIATQTSPELPSTSIDTNSEPIDGEKSAQEKMVASHQKRLERITSQLKECVDADTDSTIADNSVSHRLTELQTYLDSLTYSAPTYLNSGLYGMYGTNSDNSGGNGMGIGKGEEDSITGFRQEIRSVKGTLLSARNFPSGGTGRIGVSR